jgi:hypothetical protein
MNGVAQNFKSEEAVVTRPPRGEEASRSCVAVTRFGGILYGLHGRFGAFPADDIQVLVPKLLGRLSLSIILRASSIMSDSSRKVMVENGLAPLGVLISTRNRRLAEE